MEIGIIGAGIGGLVAAAALQRSGHQVTVFESSVVAPSTGSGLSLFANAADALAAVGLGDLLPNISFAEASAFRAGQRTPDGRWLTTMESDAVGSLRIVHRADLHAALIAALRPGTLRTGTRAQVASTGDPVLRIESADGTHEQRFDLVVAADGIRSASRKRLGLDTGLRYSGYTAWRGVTSHPVDIAGEAGETWGHGQRFGIAPLRDGRVYWFAVESGQPGVRSADERAEVLGRFANWHSPIRELVTATPAEAVLKHDIYDLAKPLRTFVSGRTVLLGDAAHAMTPDLGQGAGQAIEDAAALALLVPETADASRLDAALARYDSVRRARVQPIARQARMLGAVAHTRSRIGARLRDTVLRLTPASALTRRAAAVQRWSDPR